MKNVMVRAWEIAKDGQNKFGGKVSEYLSVALKMAWAEVKKAELTTTAGSRNHKSWVAKITGTHPRFKFNREFVKEDDYNMSEKYFTLDNGIYNVCDAGEKTFIQVENGSIVEIEEYEAKEMVA